jgi:hypothetical protein
LFHRAVTLEDLAAVELPAQAPAGNMAAAAGAKQYGNVAAPADGPAAATEEKGHIFLKGWFYLGLAGLVGSLAGWGICEPFFTDNPQGRNGWAEIVMLPLIVMFTCLGLGVAESIVERSAKKAVIRGLLALALGLVFGFIFDRFANIIFFIGQQIIAALGVQTYKNPGFWLVRGIAWAVFGVAGGIVYGLVDRSGAKTKYGILGGLIGAGLGGTVFDPISFLTRTGSLSRAVGFGLLGLATGVAIGIVESALKDAGLFVQDLGWQAVFSIAAGLFWAAHPRSISTFSRTLRFFLSMGRLKCAARRRLSALTGRYLFPARPRATGHCRAAI